MLVETFCEIHNKKSWCRLLTIGSYEFDIWDVLEHSGQPVYISKGVIGKTDYEIEQKYCRICGSTFNIRYSKNSFYIQATCECGKTNKYSWSIDFLRMFFEAEKAQQLLEQYNRRKTKKFKSRIDYWIDQGHTPEEAKIKISEWAKFASGFSPASKKGSKKHSVRCKEYWIEQGLTYSEAKDKVAEIQVTNGLAWYINKYGPEQGSRLFEERIETWLKTYYDRSDIDEINASKGRSKEQLIEQYGEDWYNDYESRRRSIIMETKYRKGLATRPEYKDKRQMYTEEVRTYTRHSISKYWLDINPDNHKVSFEDYHIDHIVSIHDGFINGVPPEIIGSKVNLRVIPQFENLSKGSRSDMSIETLKEKYDSM